MWCSLSERTKRVNGASNSINRIKVRTKAAVQQASERYADRRPVACAVRIYGTQSARKTLNSPGDFDIRSDTHTSRLPSGENMGKLLK